VLLTVDNLPQQANVKKLNRLFTQKKNFQDSLMSGAFSPSKLVTLVSPLGEEPQLTRSVKSLLVVMRNIEKDLLSARMIQNEKTFQNSITTAIGGGIFAFVLVLAILYKLNRDIFRRKKAENDVSVNEEKYRNLIENAGVVMYTADNAGIVSFANQRVEVLTGYNVEELSGKHFGMLLDPDWAEKVLSFYIEQYKNKTTTLLEFPIRTKKRRKNG
jgi:PAS domain S-box-containing protein